MRKPVWFLIVLVFPVVLFIFLDAFFPFRIPSDYSVVITDNERKPIHVFLSANDQWRIPSNKATFPPEIKKAIVRKEDRWFNFHPGVNPVSILRATFGNISDGTITSGASTITMQLARLLEPRERTLGSKLIEAWHALQLEFHYSKDELLFAYIDRLPYGSNAEGLTTAAWLYMQKPPEVLSPAELITLTIIPNRPQKFFPSRGNFELLSARNTWIEKLAQEDIYHALKPSEAILEPISINKKPFPRLLPHLSYRLKHLHPDSAIIHTSIRMKDQMALENLLSQTAAEYRFLGINNVAAMVVDNKTMKVIAYAGSSDFNDPVHAGQVDGVVAIRSPGSTLKPFIYAYALDQGLVTPEFRLRDVETNYYGYKPINYDQTWRGYVSVTEALSHSLNIPAVDLVHTISAPVVLDWMTSLGFPSLARQSPNLGLSFVLGGCGVTLEELVQAYTVFPKTGLFTKISYLEKEAVPQLSPVISASSSYLITDILTKPERPDFPSMANQVSDVPYLAWKTGTSYGRRDAWAIGYNNSYTIGVWVGNADGTGVPELIGAERATPLLFNLFRAIDKNPIKNWYNAPGELGKRLVCSVTGKIPGPDCTDLIPDYYLPGVSNTGFCDHLKQVPVNQTSTISYCNVCLPATGYRMQLFDNHPPGILLFLKTNKLPVSVPPPHNPSCTRWNSDEKLSITSPLNNYVYHVERKDVPDFQLLAQPWPDTETITWTINKTTRVKVKAGEPFYFKPDRQFYEITGTDDKGRIGTITFEVVFH